MERRFIGLMGCLPELPGEFPLSYPENAGNTIHASVPLRLFPNCVYIKSGLHEQLGYRSFVEFVNRECSHLVITLANTLKLNDTQSDERFDRTVEFLGKIDRPVVVFGLGIQTKGPIADDDNLSPSAKAFIEVLSAKSSLLGVRGASTRQVIERLCQVGNVFVTGCPSIFSDLRATRNVHQALIDKPGRPAFAGTRYFEPEDNALLRKSIEQDHWLVEPVNKFNYAFHLKAASGAATIDDLPYFTKRLLNEKGGLSFERLACYYASRLKLFRSPREWLSFNRELVSLCYGTRFHVNMAALISGTPALWITHDERTRELTRFMHLPALTAEQAADFDFHAPPALDLYDEFLDHLPGLILNFNEYLRANELPTIDAT